MKSSKEERYISVERTMRGNDDKQKIKISLSDLSQIIDTLVMYQKKRRTLFRNLQKLSFRRETKICCWKISERDFYQ